MLLRRANLLCAPAHTNANISDFPNGEAIVEITRQYIDKKSYRLFWQFCSAFGECAGRSPTSKSNCREGAIIASNFPSLAEAQANFPFGVSPERKTLLFFYRCCAPIAQQDRKKIENFMHFRLPAAVSHSLPSPSSISCSAAI